MNFSAKVQLFCAFTKKKSSQKVYKFIPAHSIGNFYFAFLRKIHTFAKKNPYYL